MFLCNKICVLCKCGIWGCYRTNENQAGRGGIRGRSFQMTKSEAEALPDVVTGTFLINSLHAKVLFDSGANFSFVSPSFALYARMNSVPLVEKLVVDTANGHESVSCVFKNCIIMIKDCELPIRLFPMPMKEFDVVVGMDWLAENKASIVCNEKIIRMELPDKRTVVLYGDHRNHHIGLLSVMKARKCIQKKCQGFIAYIVDAKKEKNKQEFIPVVSEYPEVFLEDLSGLPPDRIIEFEINLIPGAAPVAKAPYRLAPS